MSEARTVGHVLEKKGTDVATVAADATVLQAAHLMNDRRIGAVVVVENDQVVGIFSERDVLNRVVAVENAPSETLVRDVMTTPVACCRRDTRLGEARSVMRHKRIRHLPVVEEGELMGIISIGDLNEDQQQVQEDTIYWMKEYINGGYR
jgi:CBS domain-containing protein